MHFFTGAMKSILKSMWYIYTREAGPKSTRGLPPKGIVPASGSMWWPCPVLKLSLENSLVYPNEPVRCGEGFLNVLQLYIPVTYHSFSTSVKPRRFSVIHLRKYQ